MRLLYVRHGESTNNALYANGTREGRVPDPLLSPRGERQARLVGQALAREGLGAVSVWASPTARAVQTAAAIVRAGTGRSVTLVPDLVEGGGTYVVQDGARVGVPGRTLPELADLAQVPLSSSEGVDGWDGGFEDHDAVPTRAARLVESVRACGEPVLVVVGHEWLAQHVVRAALGLGMGNDACRRGWFRVPNASLTELHLHDDGTADLVRLGLDAHLGDAPDRAPVGQV